jgi:ABC-type glycerol-3-phosphate transport system permease component
MYTMELGLGLFQNRFTIEFGLISAGSVVSFLPVVVVFLLFRRNIIRGITLTGLKGA